MAVFDPKQISVIINDVQIEDWADGSDVVSYTRNSELATRTAGADGTGTFIINPDKGYTLVIKLKQNSPDNVRMQQMQKQQENNLKTFGLLTLDIKDLLNEDVAFGNKGMFTNTPAFTRGVGDNPSEWTIIFDKGGITQANGAFNE
ncbi:phage structural protein [Entomomonas asaccharolytica]|uniref:DUF3277 family protein n=1 Tax=Entomomonas asaccharolytica TaxID=2785331 RepID=A0A974RZC8_9GAMM|nr:phage protein [Entomomonas asaccharolytica]QQP86944.1 DUF3277 family protein [Entomomonas asaccharolytica]